MIIPVSEADESEEAEEESGLNILLIQDINQIKHF